MNRVTRISPVDHRKEGEKKEEEKWSGKQNINKNLTAFSETASTRHCGGVDIASAPGTGSRGFDPE